MSDLQPFMFRLSILGERRIPYLGVWIALAIRAQYRAICIELR